MSEALILELVGYAASILVAVSLMMSSVLRLRIINLIGAVTFTVYGLLIQAYPVAAVNFFIILINLYHLRKMMRAEEFFRLLEDTPDSQYLQYFLEHYSEQIRRYFPGFSYRPSELELAAFVLRDLVPAGVLLGRVEGNTLHVDLDFVIPEYRDFKSGRYLFQREAEFFRRRGITEVVSASGSEEHAAYLREIGFLPGEEPGSYRLSLRSGGRSDERGDAAPTRTREEVR